MTAPRTSIQLQGFQPRKQWCPRKSLYMTWDNQFNCTQIKDVDVDAGISEEQIKQLIIEFKKEREVDFSFYKAVINGKWYEFNPNELIDLEAVA